MSVHGLLEGMLFSSARQLRLLRQARFLHLRRSSTTTHASISHRAPGASNF